MDVRIGAAAESRGFLRLMMAPLKSGVCHVERYASPARTETSLTVQSCLDNNNERFLDSARNDRAFNDLEQILRNTAAWRPPLLDGV